MKRSLLILLLTFTIIISGCGQDSDEELKPSPERNSELLDMVKAEQQLPKDVTLSLQVSSQKEKTFEVDVIVHNPSLHKLDSVRAWVSYPTHILIGTELEIAENETIQLTAPGESEFDIAQGMAKIGVSMNPETDPVSEFTIATLSFTKTLDDAAALSFFNPHHEGNTQVLMSYNGSLRNVLRFETAEPLILQ